MISFLCLDEELSLLVLVPGPVTETYFLASVYSLNWQDRRKVCGRQCCSLSSWTGEVGHPEVKEVAWITKGRSWQDGGATEVPILRHFDHRTILEQKFVKLTALYPCVIGLGNNSTQVKCAFLMFTHRAWWLFRNSYRCLYFRVLGPHPDLSTSNILSSQNSRSTEGHSTARRAPQICVGPSQQASYNRVSGKLVAAVKGLLWQYYHAKCK